MDNLLPFFSSNANSNQEQHSTMDLTSNFTIFPSYDHHHMLPPYPNVACPMMMNPQPQPQPEAFPQIPVMQTTGSDFGSVVCNPGFGGGSAARLVTKMARINRKNAMMRSRNNPSPNSSANELAEARRQMMLRMKNIAQAAAKKDLYRYCTFDNKLLRILLVKELKNSDVGSLGRIVLPKRDCEAHLPHLPNKEGIMLAIRDANSMAYRSFRYKYWSNNKSRMYVLENTGEFVKQNGLEIGDSLTILEDERKNLYFIIRKSDKKIEVKEDEAKEDELMEIEEINVYDYIPNEEEDSIDMLIENLNDTFPSQDDFMSLALDFDASSFPPVDQVTNAQHIGSSSDLINFDDFQW